MEGAFCWEIMNNKESILEKYRKISFSQKDSGITNDPNDWAEEHNKPSYILDLLLSIINVSVQTVDIVEELPKVKFEWKLKYDERSVKQKVERIFRMDWFTFCFCLLSRT